MEYFIARQPVFYASKSVFGYELLFRNGFENCCTSIDGDNATLEVLAATLFHTPFLEMVGGKHGLVNFTRKLLLSDLVFLFEKDHMVIEVLETVQADHAVIAACARLKNAGYTIALDDFVAGDLEHPLLNLADIVKVDFMKAQCEERKTIAEKLLPRKIKLLAEKVETHADVKQGLQLGYEFFQGYFFNKPVMKTLQRMPPSGAACLRMLQMIAKDDFTFEELNDVVRSDISLCYRVLRLMNSALFSFRPEITSTFHALTLLGRAHIRRFVSIVAVNLLSASKPSELALTAMIRAKLAEDMATRIGFAPRAPEFFLMGLFSLMDAMMDRPMQDVMADLPVSQDVKTALLAGDNAMRVTLDAIVAYETADWETLTEKAGRLGLDQDALPPMYAAAIKWAGELAQSA